MTITKFKLDPDNPPKLSQEEAEILDSMRDDEINYDDIPELPPQFWYDQ